MRARIRTVKPEVFTDEDLWDLGEKTGLPVLQGFEGLWCFADREGRFEWRPRALKSGILPYWNGDFGKLLDELERCGFIVSYIVDGKKYGAIPNFLKHQAINTREEKSKLPGPPIELEQHLPKQIPPEIRRSVFVRDGEICCRCKATSDLTIDHILPRSAGGGHGLDNLRVLCRACNAARPTAGDALRADLHSDGFDLDTLLRTCTHVHAQGEGNGRERKGTEGNDACPGDTSSAPNPKSPRRRPNRPLPDDWEPTPQHRSDAVGLLVDVDRAADSFRDHAKAQDRRCADWNAAFRNWLRKERPTRPRSDGGFDPFAYAAAERAREQGGQP